MAKLKSRVKKFPGIRGLAGVAAVAGTFDASDFFDDIEDEDVAVEPSRYADPHAVVMKFLNAQQRGDTLKIGRQMFRVENANGGTVYVTKSPGAGRKLYTLKLVAFEPIAFVVDEVSSGSGVSLNNPPVARFSLDASGKLAGLGAVRSMPDVGARVLSKHYDGQFWLYHYTTAEAARRIRDSGLVPGQGERFGAEVKDHSSRGVFFSTQETKWEGASAPVLLRVATEDVVCSYDGGEWLYSGEEDEGTVFDGRLADCVSLARIPPEVIEVLTSTGWKPLRSVTDGKLAGVASLDTENRKLKHIFSARRSDGATINAWEIANGEYRFEMTDKHGNAAGAGEVTGIDLLMSDLKSRTHPSKSSYDSDLEYTVTLNKLRSHQ